MTRAFTRALGATSLAGVLAFASVAHADDKATAQASFDLGRQLMVEGRFGEACPKLEESLRLQPGVGTMLFLAACYEKVGRTASAWAQFREAESLATRVNDNRAQVARERANALEPKLAKLTLVVPPSLSALPKIEVKRDGVVLGAGVWGAPIAVDPGAHRIDVTAAGKKSWSANVTVASEDARASLRLPESLDDEIASARAEDRTPAEATDPGRTQKTIGLVVGGAGVVALGISGVFGLSAKSKLDDSNANGHCTGNLCDRIGTEARNSARDAALVSTVGFFVGLAAVGGGVALYFTAPKTRSAAAARIVPSPGGLSFAGSF